jgi:succinate-semialdehyde dehydrogenase/glutarate-semialdehyde dehydrogenase
VHVGEQASVHLLTLRRVTTPDSDLLERAQAAVTRARAAQPAWAAASLADRVAILERFRALVFAERDVIARTVSAESGKPLAESLIADVSMALDGARFLTRIAKGTLAPRIMRSGTVAAWRKTITVYHEPFGVVAVVSPWNYPFFFPAMHCITALVAGNSVLLKPSENTPGSAEHIARLLQRAGMPDGVFTILQGDGRVGAALVECDVDKVFFTGSERTGRSIATTCAPRFVPVSLELGGSDAAVVLSDADIEFTASGILWGRFTNAGQTCVAIKRVIALDSVYEALVARMIVQVHSLTFSIDSVGDATQTRDVGPLVTDAQRALITAQLDDALAQGATVAVRREPVGDDTRGAPLVVLTDVTPAMRVWHEETFGPVLVIVRAASEADAIALANATRFGLSASVWSRDRRRARQVAAELHAGSVVINDSVITAGLPEIPHGGVKASGLGRIHGVEGLLECVRTRTVVDDFLPGVRQPWWFGYAEDSAPRVDAYLRLAHGASWRERLSGIAGTLRMLLFPTRPL